jgi:hypothetical protein
LMKSASLFMRISKHSKTLSNRYKDTSLGFCFGYRWKVFSEG